MRYVSIDIETSGLDPERDQILSVGAVIEDTNNIVPISELPEFHKILYHDRISGTPTALDMNSGIIRQVARYYRDRGPLPFNMSWPDDLARDFFVWLNSNGYEVGGDMRIKIVVAGKNFASFDQRFLERLPEWSTRIDCGHKVLDPGPLFVDWEHDESLPSLQVCMDRALVVGSVTHDALQDAADVVKCLRAKYKGAE